MFKTILVPLDGSPLAERALPYAVALAQAAQGRVILLHVAPPLGWEGRPELAADVARELASAAERTRAAGVAVETRVENGYLAEVGAVIAGAALHQHADLLAMSTHGRGGLGRWIYGSAADQVFRLAAVPVLLIPSACERTWPSGRPPRILVPLDGSELAGEALGPAVTLADALRGELLLLQVYNPPYDATFDLERGLAEGREYLESVAGPLRARGKPVSVRALGGSPTHAIARFAHEWEADVIAMATHGRGGLARVVLGSVATAMVQRADVPLLLVRPAAMRPSSAQPEATTGDATRPVPEEALVQVALTPGEIDAVSQALTQLLAGPQSSSHQADLLRQALARVEQARAGLGDSADHRSR